MSFYKILDVAKQNFLLGNAAGVLVAFDSAAKKCRFTYELDLLAQSIAECWNAGVIDANLRGAKTLLESLRDALKRIYLAKAEIPPNKYLYLYQFFLDTSKAHSFDDGELLNRALYLQKHYEDHSDIGERYFLNELIFLLMAFGGKANEGLHDYLCRMFVLDFHYAYKPNFLQADFLSEFLQKFEISFDTILKALLQLFEQQTYRALDKSERRSIFNWSLHIIWVIQNYFVKNEWLGLYEPLKANCYQHLHLGEMDEAMYLHYFIYHVMGNCYQSSSQWANFNEEISRHAAAYYKSCVGTEILPKSFIAQKDKKIKIAFIRDRLAVNSPFMLEYSLLKALKKCKSFNEKYEIKVYSLNYFEKKDDDKEVINMLLKLQVPVITALSEFKLQGYYNNHYEKAKKIRQTLIEDSTDILLIPNNNYDIVDFLFASRCAPLQIFWSHGNFEYDIDGIDAKFSHFADFGKKEFRHIDIKVDKEFLNPDIDMDAARQIRNRYPKDTVILGAIGRLVKLENEKYLRVVAEIMKQCPNTVFLACGGGEQQKIKEIVKSLGVSDRFFVEGFVNQHIYGHAIDIYLNTFPLSGGVSGTEMAAKKKPVLSLASAVDKQTKQLYDEYDAYIPADESAYIQTAVKLIQSEAYRKEYGEKMYELIGIDKEEDVAALQFTTYLDGLVSSYVK